MPVKHDSKSGLLKKGILGPLRPLLSLEIVSARADVSDKSLAAINRVSIIHRLSNERNRNFIFFKIF